MCHLSTSYKEARECDITYGNKIIRKVKNNEMGLRFPKLNLGKLYILCHSDASFNNLSNGGSQGAFVILLGDVNGNCSPIQWQSKKVRRIVKSTLAAECLSMENAVDSAFYIKNVLCEILKLSSEQVHLKCVIDNASLYESLFSTKKLREDKRLILDISLLKEMYNKGEINSITLVESANQLADSLTKQGAPVDLLRRTIQGGHIGRLYENTKDA